MITELQIDQIFEKIGEEKDESILKFIEGDKKFSAYLLGDQFKLLSETEKELLLFIHLTIWFCYDQYGQAFDFIIEDFTTIEEENWTKIENNKLSSELKIDLLFENYPQEDLLAFVEDMLQQEEITPLGKELIFVTAKSYIDYRF